MLTCANSYRLTAVALTSHHPFLHGVKLNTHIRPMIPNHTIYVPSPGQSHSELIVAPPPPWPFSCCESTAPQQPSTSVIAAFITPKREINAKPENIISQVGDENPPLAELDDVFESHDQTQESGGMFLEEDDSKQDTIKRCPQG